jgi:hypothetical protein
MWPFSRKQTLSASDPSILKIERDDDRPVAENVCGRSELLAGFVVTFNQPLNDFDSGHLRVWCVACGGVAIDRSDFTIIRASGMLGPKTCQACNKVMLNVYSDPAPDHDNVMIFAITLAGSVPGTGIRPRRCRFQIEDLRPRKKTS